MFDTKNQLGEEKKGFTSALQSIQRTHLRPQQCPIDHVTHPFPSGLLHKSKKSRRVSGTTLDVQKVQLCEVELVQIRVLPVDHVQRTHLPPWQCPIDHMTHPYLSGSLHF